MKKEKREFDEQVGYIIAAMMRIREINGELRGVRGTIECPKCGARLHYTISSYNGHVHGKCETQGCVSWMQ